ncbi:MAG: UDP-N-acetylmuramoyl-tripeptide--D-alanyl-D-alanine ligase [Ruminococcus sp.]|nr:UDP-N-acetylmuramoyl-tripeptide--D-alanyl-D-alanine ligase [Ruminococcus sp.]
MTLNEIVRACRGSFGYPAEIEINKITADLERVTDGDVFISLEENESDSVTAFSKGAVAVVCTKPVKDVKCIIVDDTRTALLQIAGFYRRKFPVKLFAITGSVGKTTVTQMLREILSLDGETLSTKENHHNEIGLPTTLFELCENHKNAVVEMGLSATNGISALSTVAQPDVCVITNIGYSHYENYQSHEGILKAKLKVLDGAPYDAPLVVNKDDKILATLDFFGTRKIITYSTKDKSADFYADSVKTVDEKLSFKVNYPDGKCEVNLNCMGYHNVSNALCAFATAYSQGIEVSRIISGLLKYTPDNFRQQFINTKSCRVLADLSNFSPEAVKASAEIIKNCQTGEGGRRIAVLSDMTSLGKKSQSLHKSVGESLEKSNIDLLFCIDERADGYIQGAVKKGLPEENARLFSDKEELKKALKETVKPQDVVLLKCRREYTPFEILEELDR